MKVKITKPVVIGGFPGALPGHVIEMSDKQASEVVASGWGEVFNAVVDVVETRTPEVETRDPLPSKKRSKSALP